MVEKLRIAVVVEDNGATTKKGTILFGNAENFCEPLVFHPDIEMKKPYSTFFYCRLMSTVIDTRHAKGNAALGAFLMMVKHYRLARTTGLDWPVRECRADDAYRALERLYENGDVDDTITIKINDADCKISRVSAETMIEALRAELKWDQR